MNNQSKLPLIAVSIGFFLVIMDVTIVNVALPQLAHNLNSNLSQLQWVVDGYTLTFACFLLTAGYMADLFGAKKIYLLGVAGFIITSFGCGLAINAMLLIIFRLLQGLTAALLIPASLSLINHSYPTEEDRASAIAIWASAGAIAAACGPVLGGILVNYYSWRSVFLVNIPIGIIGVYLSHKYTQDTVLHKEQKVRFDIPGQLLIMISIAALSFGLIEAPNLGWGSIVTISTFIIFFITLILFIIVEAKHTHPVVDISLFKNIHFSISAILGILLNFAFYGFMFIMPLYLHTVKHFTSLQIGFALCPLMLLMLLANLVSGKMCNRLGTKPPVVYGFLIASGGFLSLSILIFNNLSYTIMVLPLLALGFSAALAMPALTVTIIGATPKNKIGFASAIFNASRQLGSLLGVAIFGTIVNMVPNLILGMDLTLIIATISCIFSAGLAILFIKNN
jgi:DHA2 family methylenomycin A resistance protein-like MFS transporter